MSENPLEAVPSSGPGTPPTPPASSSPAARLRWTTGQGIEETVIDPAEAGVVLIPVPGVAAQMAAVFLEAQDEAANTRKARVRRSHGDIELFLDVPEEWPAPSQPPSLVLGGGTHSRKPGLGVPDRHAAALVGRAHEVAGKRGIDLILAYPRRRRALAGVIRRLETDLQAVEKDVRKLFVRSQWFLAGACAGLGGGALAAFFRQGDLVMAAGGLMAGAAAAWAGDQLARARRGRRRSVLRTRLELASQRAEKLDDLAFRVTRSLGAGTIWELASRLERALQTIPEGLEAPEIPSRALQWARRLAAELGVPPEDVERAENWWPPPPAEAAGWPLEVARTARRSRPAQIVTGLATLADRVEGLLPAPWPVVVFEPWPGEPAAVRAARLMALSRLTPGRPVVAFITP